LKFEYLAQKHHIFYEREDTFFSDPAYKNLILAVEKGLITEGVKFEEVVNYNDIILNNFNRLSPFFLEWLIKDSNLKNIGIEANTGYRLFDVIDETNIGKGAL
jgi:hypothetical protein